MNKTLSAMVATAALCLASQASAVTVNFVAGSNIATGIAGITYSTSASYGDGGFGVNATNAFAQGNANGMGVNATLNGPGSPANTPPDAGFRNVIDTRVGGVSVVGAWEMLTVTFSSAVNLSNFIVAMMDEDDDFEYSFNGGAFISVGPAMESIPANFTLTQSVNIYEAASTGLTSFRIRATGVGADDNDDFALRSVNISAVPLPAGAPLLLAGLAGLAFLRRRKQA